MKIVTSTFTSPNASLLSLLILCCMTLAPITSYSKSAPTDYGELAYQYLKEIASSDNGIGARQAGTKQEKLTADYVANTLTSMGYVVERQPFDFADGKRVSQNLIVNTAPNLKRTIILGAHYDSTAQQQGSLGATDNGAGIAALLAIAKAMKAQKSLAYNIRFIAFGAEEVGLKGSQHYVKELGRTPSQYSNIIGMINFDTIAGGDYTYVHSAHTTPYQCDGKSANYSSAPSIRDALLLASVEQLGENNKYIVHPNYPGYPEGVTGSWSDHAPFACAGIPIAYVESTNFTINGKDGYDGYSQTTNPKLWDCFDSKNNTACDSASEKKWGNIWHTKNDRLSTLNQLFPNRVKQQITNNVRVLTRTLTTIGKEL